MTGFLAALWLYRLGRFLNGKNFRRAATVNWPTRTQGGTLN
jgi:hypothetical protein